MMEIRAEGAAAPDPGALGLIIVDYLQLMTSGASSRTRVRGLADRAS
jgi:replicative DNA helicase